MNSFLKMFAKAVRSVPLFFENQFDKYYLSDNVPMAQKVSHNNWKDYLYEIGNKEGLKILEIGSREVTGKSTARSKFNKATYVGFDYYPGPNVDVVGDVHKLSSYFNEGEQFDIIYSSACFEHFAMPWVVTTEITKLLKVGGHLFVETHFSFSSHERPWHFFHYTDMALKTLFSPALGYECIEVGFSNPVVGRFSKYADKYLANRMVPGLYCHIGFLGKKIKEVNDFKWEAVNLSDVVAGTEYPKPLDGKQ